MSILTAANVAYIARTGTLQLGSTALQAAEWAVAIIVFLVVIAVLAWQAARWAAEIRRTCPQRIDGPAALPAADPCPCCTGEPCRNNDCTCREDCGFRLCQAADEPEPCLWCTPGNNFTDSTRCTCTGPCERGYCKRRSVRADGVLEAVEIVTEENRA